MLLVITVFALIFLSSFIISPAIWCGVGKIFRIEDLTFKKAIITYLLIALINVAFTIFSLGLAFLIIDNFFIDLIIFVASLVVGIWILKVRFNTTVIKSIVVFVSPIVYAVCIALLTRTFVIQAFVIPSGAMKQSLLIGDHIIVNKYIYAFKEPQRGDIIVFEFPVEPEKDFIKRVVGLPGDTIEGRDKIIYVNNEPLEEPYVVHTDFHVYPKGSQTRDNFGPITVPDNAFFVMGDNRDQSFDSRFWGFVDRKAIRGKAFVIYYSQDKEDGQVRSKRIGKPL